jgi:hypothetical protein
VSLSALCVQLASGGGAHTPVSAFSLADERQMQMTTFAEHAWLAAEEENSTTVDVCIQVGSALPTSRESRESLWAYCCH